MFSHKMPHSTSFTQTVTITLLLLTLTPGVQSMEYHQQSYQTLSSLALRLARWRERACGSPDFQQRPLDLRRVWVSVGHALMAGLGCDDREHTCPGRPSCLQLITQTVEEAIIKNRYTREVPEMTQGHSQDIDIVDRHLNYPSHHSQASHKEHEHSQNLHRLHPDPQAQHRMEPPIPGNDHEDSDANSTDQNEHPLANHRSHESQHLRGPLRVSAENEQGSRHHDGFFSSQQDFSHKSATLTIHPVHHESHHLHDEDSGNQISRLKQQVIASNSGHQGNHPLQPPSAQHPDQQTSHPMQQVKAPNPGHQKSHPIQQTLVKESVLASHQDNPDDQPPSLSHGHQPSFLNQSVVFMDVLFAAVSHVSTEPEQCGLRPQGYRLSPRSWADRVCRKVEVSSGISEIVQREVITLEQSLRKVFGRWRPERFLSGIPPVDSDSFLEQHKCFNVLVPEERPHRVTVVNCRREIHDFIRRLSLTIFTRLLQGHRPVLNDQPCEADFLRDVLDKYGAEKDHRVFSVEGVQKMIDIMETRINCSREANLSASRTSHLDRLTMGYQSTNRSSPDQHGERNKRHGYHEDKESVTSSHGHRFINKRFSAGELVSMVLDNRTLTINVQQFYRLCPALLQQLLLMMTTQPEEKERPEAGSDFFGDGDGGDDDGEGEDEAVRATPVQTYGLGTASVGVLVLCSLLGAIVVKGSEALGGHSATVTLLAVTVGQLCGQAMLHLLPKGLGHGFDKFKDGIANGDDSNDDDSVYYLAGGFVIDDVSVKCLAVLGGVYLFWLLEILTCHYYRLAALRPQGVDKQPDMSDYEMRNHQKQPTASPAQEKYYNKTSGHLVWLVVAGDTVHNLVQGLTIGASYVHSVPHGLSAAIAVVCREIPHEIGDFAVLLSTGMKVKTALLINLLSTLAAFLGLYVALGTGEALLPVLDWFYLLLAGIFLYLALTCLIPELVRHFRHCGNTSTFIAHNLGLLGGFSLMFLILISERKIERCLNL